MAVKLASYSQYLQQVTNLMGVPVSRLSTEIAEALRIAWNSALERVWSNTTWLDICPYGEARFVGNQLTYPNDLSKSAWTATNLTITGDQLKNPLDGRVTASKLLETVTNAAHSAAQGSLPITVSTAYSLSAYVRPNGRSWVYLKFTDGVNTYSSFYNVTTGAVGTTSGTGATASMQQMPSGFYLCTLNFTTDASASATGTATLQISTDGTTLSYAGTTTIGLYVWGCLLQQLTNLNVSDSLVVFDQTGEERMEAVFQVWQDSPFNSQYPREVPYLIQKDGIQIICGQVVSYPVVNSAGVTITSPQYNPVFIWYRKQMPDFSGSTYSASATYAIDDQIFFTNSASISDYWKCTAATSAGQSPDTTPTKWSKLAIPDSLLWCTTQFAFSDWLISDGQNDKAVIAEARAQARMDSQADRESRQMGRDQLPFRVFTHVTSRGTPY